MAWWMPATRVASGRHDAWAVTLVAMNERPWYAMRSAMISLRPVCRHAIMSAVSMASVPELVKNVRFSFPGAMSASRRAASTWTSVAYSVDTWPRRLICSVTRSMMRGWQWPSDVVRMPLKRSRYSLPSASRTRTPFPSTSARGSAYMWSMAGSRYSRWPATMSALVVLGDPVSYDARFLAMYPVRPTMSAPPGARGRSCLAPPRDDDAASV